MTNLKLNLFFIIFIIGAGTLTSSCSQSQNRSKYSIDQAPNIECCMVRGRNGQCYQELVPGCASNSAPLFQEKFFKPDTCCAYWGVDGMCYEELVKNCSQDYRL